MQEKSEKEQQKVIQDIKDMERINSFHGTKSMAVFINDNCYIISSDAYGADFDTGVSFLRWRLKLLGVRAFMKEIDTTEFNFVDETLDAMDCGWDESYIKEILAECYGMEDLND